jgi:hypothetical protein
MWVPSVRVKANNKNIVVKIILCHHEKSLYGFWHTVKFFTMGHEKVFTIVNMKFRNIFVFLPITFGEGLRLPSLLILRCILHLRRQWSFWRCFFLIDHVRVDVELWSEFEGKLLPLSIDLKCDLPSTYVDASIGDAQNGRLRTSKTLEFGCISNTTKSTGTKNSRIFTGTFLAIPDG